MGEVCPAFGHFSVHEQMLMKLSQYLTVFQSHFSKNFVKSFGLFTEFNEIL
jgi:hypothetical protein